MKKSASVKFCFFLVDPETKIQSTENVPPQQQVWMAEALKDIYPFSQLPVEIIHKILGFMWPMPLEVAKEHREVLMKERKYLAGKNNDEIFERLFSLCEH